VGASSLRWPAPISRQQQLLRHEPLKTRS